MFNTMIKYPPPTINTSCWLYQGYTQQQWLKVMLRKWREQVVSAYPGQLVKASEQFGQRHDQLLGRALRRQAGEAFNVCKQYAAGEAILVGSKGEGEGHQNRQRGKERQRRKRIRSINTV